jgi:transcriptional regulator with XRE-family HTH domain
MADFLGVKLREMREQRHTSLRALADELGITAMTVSRYENGHREPDLQMIERLAHHFRVPIGCFIGQETMRMNEIYQLSLEKEVAAELASHAMNRLVNHMLKAGISLDDANDPLVVLYNELSELSDGIVRHTSVDEAKETGVYLKHVHRYIGKLEECLADGLVA